MLKNKVKMCRAERSLTQEELGKKVGVTRQTIISIEQGRYVPSLALGMRIAKTLNKKIEEVFKL